jgi:hypothetical protein
VVPGIERRQGREHLQVDPGALDPLDPRRDRLVRGVDHPVDGAAGDDRPGLPGVAHARPPIVPRRLIEPRQSRHKVRMDVETRLLRFARHAFSLTA